MPCRSAPRAPGPDRRSPPPHRALLDSSRRCAHWGSAAGSRVPPRRTRRRRARSCRRSAVPAAAPVGRSWTPAGPVPPVRRRSIVVAIELSTKAPSDRSPSSTSQTPSSKSAMTCAPSSTASRVLPTPPGPVRVNSRADARMRLAPASSLSRPMKAVSSRGRLLGRASSVRSGPNSDGCPATLAW